MSKSDPWTGSHDYSWGPGGVLFDSSGSTTYTPGFAHRRNGGAQPPWHSPLPGSL